MVVINRYESGPSVSSGMHYNVERIDEEVGSHLGSFEVEGAEVPFVHLIIIGLGITYNYQIAMSHFRIQRKLTQNPYTNTPHAHSSKTQARIRSLESKGEQVRVKARTKLSQKINQDRPTLYNRPGLSLQRFSHKNTPASISPQHLSPYHHKNKHTSLKKISAQRLPSYASNTSNSSIPNNIRKDASHSKIVVDPQSQVLLEQVTVSITRQAVKAYKEQRVSEALELFKTIRKSVKTAEVAFYLGSCLLNLGRHQASILHLNECLSLDPKHSPMVYLYIAVNFKKMNNTHQALKVLAQGLEHFPHFEEGLFYRGKLLMKTGSISEAIDAFRRCLAANQGNQLGRMFLGDCLRRVGKDEDALEQYMTIIQKERKGGKGKGQSREGSRGQGGKYGEMASLRAAGVLLQMHQKQGKQTQHHIGSNNNVPFAQKAMDILLHLSSKNPDNSILNYHLALAHLLLSDLPQSTLYFQSCLSSTSDLRLAYSALMHLLEVAVWSGNFYEAQHIVTRIERLEEEGEGKKGIKEEGFRVWRGFVEGVTDLGKRKNQEGCDKLRKAVQTAEGCLYGSSVGRKSSKNMVGNTGNSNRGNKQHQPVHQSKITAIPASTKTYCQRLLRTVYPYLAYALFCTQALTQSLQAYQKALALTPSDTLDSKLLHCLHVVQGLIHNENKEYGKAEREFEQAYGWEERGQALFMGAVMCVKEYKSFGDRGRSKVRAGNVSSRSRNSMYLDTEGQNSRGKGQLKKPEVKLPKQTSPEYYLLKADGLLQKARTLPSPHHLLLFYHSLLSLHLQSNQALDLITAAISHTDQPVSEYHFIHALSLFQHCDSDRDAKDKGYAQRLPEAISAITKAIQIDPAILQFYRQRSKYYFLAEEYSQALYDCRKAQSMDPADEQLQLLMSFYLYLNDQPEEAHRYLRSIRGGGPEEKLREFQEALELRMGKYKQLGSIGGILEVLRDMGERERNSKGQESQAIERESEKEQDLPISLSLLQPLTALIQSRHQFSQFSVYFYHLLLACALAYNRQFQSSLQHLFGCLSQIQMLIEEKEQNRQTFEVSWEQTEQMLDEVKFNICVVTLMKVAKGSSKEVQNRSTDVDELRRYIEVFREQTTSDQLRQVLNNIYVIVQQSFSPNTTTATPRKAKEIHLTTSKDKAQISDTFPHLSIALPTTTIVARFRMSYPVKLKFTIAPQFEPGYLLNFDVDKIEWKVPPPWLHLPKKDHKNQNKEGAEGSFRQGKSKAVRMNQRHTFTNVLCDQSVKITESRVSSVKEEDDYLEEPRKFVGRRGSSSRYSNKRSIIEQLKLDRGVEEKLQKLIKN